ncbi:MAG: hypothetical protein IMY67_11140 [Bacteroidetes bacterium]|nr:hypothetical protein [Bacteroidota bacterium]
MSKKEEILIKALESIKKSINEAALEVGKLRLEAGHYSESYKQIIRNRGSKCFTVGQVIILETIEDALTGTTRSQRDAPKFIKKIKEWTAVLNSGDIDKIIEFGDVYTWELYDSDVPEEIKIEYKRLKSRALDLTL